MDWLANLNKGISAIKNKEVKQTFDISDDDTILINTVNSEIKKKNKSFSIKEKDFEDIYDKRTINQDLQEVTYLKNKFKEYSTPEGLENKVYADVLEGILGDAIEMADWLGENAIAQKTCDFDDFKNGVDVVVEFSPTAQSTSHLGLAVDVTYAKELDKKLNRIRNEIDNGRLAMVKYFESDNGDFKGRLLNVPRVVIGCDKETIAKLARLWVDKKKSSELAKHHVMYQIISQITVQLEMFRSYADSIGQKNIATKLDNSLKLITGIKKKKLESVSDNGRRDHFHDNLMMKLQTMF